MLTFVNEKCLEGSKIIMSEETKKREPELRSVPRCPECGLRYRNTVGELNPNGNLSEAQAAKVERHVKGYSHNTRMGTLARQSKGR